MKMKLAAVIVLGVVGIGAILVTTGVLPPATAATTEYLTSPAAVGDVTDEIAASGAIASASRTAVNFGTGGWAAEDTTEGATSPVTYPIIQVSVNVGDTVAEGDVLATADTSDLRDELARARNDLKSAQVSMRAADDELDDASTTAAKRQAKISRYNALNAVDEAETRVDEVKAQIEAATLVAPIAGLVTEVALVAGSDAPTGAGVVIDSSIYEVTTDVVESDLASVEVGQSASVTISAIDADVEGTVTDISPTASDSSGSGVVSYPVTVRLTTTPGGVHSGMSADVTITTKSATNVLTIPAAALNGRDGNYSVMTLGADGTPVRTVVQVGLVTNTLAEITSGLTEGTNVVTGTASDLAGSVPTQNGGFGGPGGGGVVGGGGGVVGGGGPQFPNGPRNNFVPD
jgi:macrolide-specific efflux system membrane fusion protein